MDVRRCYVTGCGPSLLKVNPRDIEWPVIAVNESFWLFPKVAAHVINDPEPIARLGADLRAPLWTTHRSIGVPGHVQVVMIPTPVWGEDSTVLVALQVANVLGFDEIHLLGVDHKDGDTTHFYGSREERPENRQVWYDATFPKFQMARDWLADRGIKIYSHCPDSPLNTIFEYYADQSSQNT